MLFSVLLSVYSKEDPKYLNDSLESIYDKQSLKPSEIILVKDGLLPPKLNQVIEYWQCKLGKLFITIQLEHNVGLARALNVGLEKCSHELVARMDTDDISTPTRFEKQIAFMMENQHIVASSGEVLEFDINMARQLGVRSLPINSHELVKFCRFRSPLSHPAVIFRRSKIMALGGYPNFSNSQDWALWSLLISKGEVIANIESTLVHMRTDSSLLERRGVKYYRNELKIFKFQREIGLLRRRDFLFNVISKGVLRASPNLVKRLAYKKLRN
ncbi:glycosyltransferase [Vibrio fortis]|uniref:glycosyltransferase n=1 Tax=Vibrio fortis TaxID=212667 RepID=UPI0036F24DA4